MQVCKIYDHSDQASNDIGYKDQSSLTQVESIDMAIHQWKDLKKGVARRVSEGGVHVREQNSWIFDHNLEGYYKCVHRNGLERKIFLVDFALKLDISISCCFCETAGMVEQDGAARRFGKARDPNDIYWARSPSNFPHRPSPASHEISIIGLMNWGNLTHPSATTEKPESTGPKAGAADIPATQKHIAEGKQSMEYCKSLVLCKQIEEVMRQTMSCMVAPPFARQGLPKEP
jgi:hypothetical protein